MSSLRSWILTDLDSLIPAPTTIWSDINKVEFQTLTGLTHEDLLTKWHGPIDPATNKRTGKGTEPTITTCTSFLPIYASRVRSAGSMAMTQTGKSGKQIPIGLKPFLMNMEKGWIPATSGGQPTPGDFFFIGTQTKAEHVGIVVAVNGTNWACVAGGAGGKGTGRDGVKRTPLGPRMEPVFGWLDVDVYFAGWKTPDSIYDEFDE